MAICMYLAHGIGRRLVETLDRTAHLKLRHHLARGDFVVLASDLKVRPLELGG